MFAISVLKPTWLKAMIVLVLVVMLDSCFFASRVRRYGGPALDAQHHLGRNGGDPWDRSLRERPTCSD